MGMGTGEEEGKGGVGEKEQDKKEKSCREDYGDTKETKSGCRGETTTAAQWNITSRSLAKNYPMMKFKGVLQMRFQTLREGWRNYTVW